MSLAFPIALLAAMAPAHAFTAPIGWTAVGAHLALLDPKHPEKGELREIIVSGGQGDPDELSQALTAAGFDVVQMMKDASGAVNVWLNGRLARARPYVDGEEAIWEVVLVAPDHAASIDPDALLMAVQPTSDLPRWGGRVQVLAGGGDGSPWGDAAPFPTAGGAWGQDVQLEGWSQDREMIGVWVGSGMLGGTPTRLEFRFDGTGNFWLTRRAEGMVPRQTEGTWASRNGLLRMTLPGEEQTGSYEVLGSTLSIDFEGAHVTLHKQSS